MNKTMTTAGLKQAGLIPCAAAEVHVSLRAGKTSLVLVTGEPPYPKMDFQTEGDDWRQIGQEITAAAKSAGLLTGKATVVIAFVDVAQPA